MNAKSLTTVQKTALIVSAISLLVWGIPFIFFPQFLWTEIGGVPEAVSPIYTRYSGAWFLGSAFAAIVALRNPALIGALFDLLAIAAGLTFLVLLWDYFAGNSPAADWFIWVAIIDALVICVLSFVSRPKAGSGG